MKNLLPTVTIVLFTICNACDSTEPPITPPAIIVNNSIELTEEWKDLTSIKIKFTKSETDTISSYEYKLLTSTGKEIVYPKITGEDTSYTHTGLSEGQSVSFKVEAFEATNLKDTSSTFTLATLSPTSHDITWEVDTLGQPGNFLSDIWGIDENNVWAVGGISLASGGSTIIKWDGNRWNLHSFPDGSAYSIWGFSENEIIVVGEWSNRGFIGHFDGINWTEYKSNYFDAKEDTVYPLRAVWGSAANDVWAVGDRGTLIHWDGFEWSKQQIDSTFNQYKFTDIWGFSEKEIYIAGRIYQEEATLLGYDGNNWETVIKNTSLTTFATVWGPYENKIYFIEYKNYSIINGNINLFSLPGLTSGVEKIRGSGSNNIYTVGHFGEVFHFDGLQWKRMDELNTPFTESSALNSCYVTSNQVFIVGVTPVGAMHIRGKIQQ